MRRFVALPVPAQARERLDAALEAARARFDDRVRWVRPEGWHVTLAFLGEVADEDVTDVVEVLRDVLARVPAPRRLRLSGAGRFGGSVLWAGLADDPEGSVAVLGDELQSTLQDAGLPVQVRPVAPHVTLARSPQRKVSAAIVDAIDVPDAGWTVTSVELWRSRLGRGPARYEVDASLPVD